MIGGLRFTWRVSRFTRHNAGPARWKQPDSEDTHVTSGGKPEESGGAGEDQNAGRPWMTLRWGLRDTDHISATAPRRFQKRGRRFRGAPPRAKDGAWTSAAMSRGLRAFDEEQRPAAVA